MSHSICDTILKTNKHNNFPINDHMDLLIEILQRLDGRSLSTAACVCKKWWSIVKNDSLWEHLCFRQLSMPPSVGIRSVVMALGGYRRLYLVCVRPVVSRLKRRRRVSYGESSEVEMWLSLFSVECYERLLGGGGGGGGVVAGESTAKSLRFLCEGVNV
ncbi:hypothetical protein QVD17_14322 [Tagetes erecta]|uniref:F-box domain-containing protein n=1 Tax=Tagetes erecta TaxID=13708 RepID=A0AAD8L4G7_TARER|nr:hypothetical protein QVD17_14322 [Tagetes erecta]